MPPREIPPPPPPELVWTHGKPSLAVATVLIVFFTSYLGAVIAFVVWSINHAPA